MKRYFLVVIGVWMSLVGAQAAEPTAAGASVAVVYNSSAPASRELAEYYAQRRGVPTNQLFGFELPSGETMSRAEFQEQLQRPLLQALDQTGLLVLRKEADSVAPGEWRGRVSSATIRYLVLCWGVPVRVLPDPLLKEADLDSIPEPLRSNEAAVDSELAVLPQFYGRPLLTGALSNPAYSATNAALVGPESGLLMVARLDGPDATVARRLVDRGLQAEQYGLWGRAYVDLRGVTNAALLPGDQWLGGAAEVLRRAGFESVVDTNQTTFGAGFPMSHIAFYAGWYDAAVSGPFGVLPVEFAPGAFAYHLYSFSARTLRSRDAGWVGPLLDRGATVSVGYVAEPYLPTTLDVRAFMVRWVPAGFTFGEAVYASLPVLSWQATVVGDPLYAPFGRPEGAPLGVRFRDLHIRLAGETNDLIEWSHLQVVNLGLTEKSGIPPRELVQYVAEQATTLQSAVLEEKHGDLLWSSGRLQPAIRAYAQALEWGGSRQQRIRMMLRLAQLYDLYTQRGEALAVYEKLLDEEPDYADRVTVLEKALRLARILKREESVIRLRQELAELGGTP